MKFDLSVRGMRDYYPDVFYRLNHIFRAWKETALSYGFEEFDGPVLESLELYTIKSGDEIVSQLYNFTDKGGRELALRPELTPTLARMVAKIQSQASKPLKWFSIPRCMRYEKPQKGRLREFFQFNVDILGEDSELADLEIISVGIDSLRKLGLTSNDFVVKINNRDFVSDFFKTLGIDPQKTTALYKIIDNARKEDRNVTLELIEQIGLAESQKSSVEQYLEIRGFSDIEQTELESRGRDSLLSLFSLINTAELGDFCEFDPSIVRGLDYYTGTVFEIYDRSEKMRAICGGGRYNNLLKEFSGVELPACGFGMGDVVLGEILIDRRILPEYRKQTDYFLVRITDKELGLLLRVARALREKGLTVEYAYRLQTVKKQMSRASKIPSKKALIFGSEEISRGKLVEKDMETGEEVLVNFESLIG